MKFLACSVGCTRCSLSRQAMHGTPVISATQEMACLSYIILSIVFRARHGASYLQSQPLGA